MNIHSVAVSHCRRAVWAAIAQISSTPSEDHMNFSRQGDAKHNSKKPAQTLQHSNVLRKTCAVQIDVLALWVGLAFDHPHDISDATG
jgi:hypothetical protein